MYQWHTLPPPTENFPPKFDWSDIRLDQVVYGNCSPYVEERLGDFYEYLKSQSYRPPKDFKDLGDFITGATKLQIISLAGAGWKWEKKPYVPDQLLPRDTFQYPRRTWGLNRDNVWRCCGYRKDHPGCWTGPVKYDYDAVGTYWKEEKVEEKDGKYYDEEKKKKKLEYVKKISTILEILNDGILFCDTNNLNLARDSLKNAKDLYKLIDQDDDIDEAIRDLIDCINNNNLDGTRVLDSDDEEDDFGNDQGGVTQALDLLPPLPVSPIKSKDSASIERIQNTRMIPDNIDELEQLLTQIDSSNPIVNETRTAIFKLKRDAEETYRVYLTALTTKNDLNVPLDDPKLFERQQISLRLERSKWVKTPVDYNKLRMGTGFGGRVGLKWCENSCWIDTIFTSLFLLQNTSLIREILTSPKRLNIKDGCMAQKYHDALLKDILTLQQSEVTKPSKLRLIWNNCVEENPPPLGEFYSATRFLESLIMLYNCKHLQISSEINSNRDWLYLDENAKSYPLQNGEYTRTALIISRNNSHFLTILYDYTKDESWFVNANSGDVPETIVQMIPRKEIFDYNDLTVGTKEKENPENNPYTYKSVAAVYMRNPKLIKVPEDLTKKSGPAYYREQENFIRRFRGESDQWVICNSFSPGEYRDDVDKMIKSIRIFLWLAAHGKEVEECKRALGALKKNKHNEYYKELTGTKYVKGAVNDI